MEIPRPLEFVSLEEQSIPIYLGTIGPFPPELKGRLPKVACSFPFWPADGRKHL